jgi:hypothetical protein
MVTTAFHLAEPGQVGSSLLTITSEFTHAEFNGASNPLLVQRLPIGIAYVIGMLQV